MAAPPDMALPARGSTRPARAAGDEETGEYTGMSHEDNVAARQAIEDLIGLEEYYAIEEQTVEDKKWGKR
jgi:hypothetical protein